MTEERTEEQPLPAPPTGTPTPPGEVTEDQPEPTENDDKTDVQPRPEPKEAGDPHGSPLDDPEDERFVRKNDPDEPGD